jgi:hypothetical protein
LSGHDRLYSFELSQALETGTDRREGYSRSDQDCGVPLQVALLTYGGDKPYALGLAAALVSQGIFLDFIGSDEVNAQELHTKPYVTLRGDQRQEATINLGSGRKKRLINCS